jgi:hypothetical protein
MEPGGKGSFQAVKLQRPARTTVCSHSTRDITAIGSIESKHDNNDTVPTKNLVGLLTAAAELV